MVRAAGVDKLVINLIMIIREFLTDFNFNVPLTPMLGELSLITYLTLDFSRLVLWKLAPEPSQFPVTPISSLVITAPPDTKASPENWVPLSKVPEI